MRVITLLLEYMPIEKLISFIDKKHRDACLQILIEHRALFERIRGSTHNHQTWEGGYIDHVTDCLNYANHLYQFDRSFGRYMPFSISDVLLVLFLHDLEKPWRIEVLPDGTVRNRPDLDTKEAFREFREAKLREYGLSLTPYQMNALTYVEGEYQDYSSKRRVMNELASFCHRVDMKSAREWYDYPKATDDEWPGAKRFRTP